jgi:hypothetical protein
MAGHRIANQRANARSGEMNARFLQGMMGKALVLMALALGGCGKSENAAPAPADKAAATAAAPVTATGRVANALLQFEQNIQWTSVSSGWAAQREGWITAVKAAKNSERGGNPSARARDVHGLGIRAGLVEDTTKRLGHRAHRSEDGRGGREALDGARDEYEVVGRDSGVDRYPRGLGDRAR